MKTMRWNKALALVLALISTSLWAADGTLHWARLVDLSSPISGVIEKVNVGAGQTAKQGQILLQYDQQVLLAKVNNLKAQLGAARKLRDEADMQYKRAQEMYAQNMLSEHDLQLAKLAALQAHSDYVKVKSQLDAAEYQLKYSRVIAPYSALVLQVHVVPGSTVVQNQEAHPLVTIASDQYMVAMVQLDIDDAVTLKPGDKARVKVNGDWYNGHITQVEMGYSGTETSAMVAVEFAIPVRQKQVYAGMKVSVELP